MRVERIIKVNLNSLSKLKSDKVKKIMSECWRTVIIQNCIIVK